MKKENTMKKSLLPEPENKTVMKSLHFRTCGDGMNQLAISLFWFEDREKLARAILDNFPQLTEKQKNKILWGGAKLSGTSICGDPECEQCKDEKNPLHYIEEPDKEMQKEIIKRMKWLDKNYFKMGEFHVKKQTIYNYLGEIKLWNDLVIKESQTFMDLLEKNIPIFYNAIFQDVTLLPPKPEDIPKAGTRRYEFALELELFFNKNKEELMDSEEVRRRVSHRMLDLQRDSLMVRYSMSKEMGNGKDLANAKSAMSMLADAISEKEEKIDPFTQAQIDASPKVEMKLESGKILQVPQILLDEYANSVRITRSEMLFAKPTDISLDGIVKSQNRLHTRIDCHKAIYKSVGIVYHLEHAYFAKKSDEQFPDKKDQQFFRKMTDEERESIEFNGLIQEYVEKKYPDISSRVMFGTCNSTIEEDRKEKTD